MPQKLLILYGTRPELIKMAPVIKAARQADRFELRTCLTGQHAELLDEIAPIFDVTHDYNLRILETAQSLSSLTASAITGLDRVIGEWRPDWVLVQGDTTSAMAGALVAFYHRCRIGHVEAGLRTGQIFNPWPEEFNRRATALIADRHFAPTEAARANLLKEGVPDEAILVTGNTVIDALLDVVRRIQDDAGLRERLAAKLPPLDPRRRLILVTGHRRESFGAGFESICRAIARLAARGDVQIVYPVHLNPNVQEPVFRLLGGLPAVTLCAPLDYLSFVYLMMQSTLILTDSGGVQEEAPSLGKPVLVMREASERNEAVAAGVAELVGTDADRIVAAATRLLDDDAARARMVAANPFGDGHAGARIVESLIQAP